MLVVRIAWRVGIPDGSMDGLRLRGGRSSTTPSTFPRRLQGRHGCRRCCHLLGALCRRRIWDMECRSELFSHMPTLYSREDDILPGAVQDVSMQPRGSLLASSSMMFFHLLGVRQEGLAPDR